MSTPTPAPKPVDEPKPAAKPAAVPAKVEAPKPDAPNPEPSRVPRSAIELRAARRRTLQRRYGIWVGIPTLLAIIYYLLIATPQYDSILTIAVESSEGRINEAAGKVPNAGNARDARLLREAMRSAPALAALDHDSAFRTHYREHGDWMNRLANDAGADATLSYFRDKVAVTQETGTSLSTVRVRAFSGAAAHDLATKLLAFAQKWVADQNQTSSAARLNQAQLEVTREQGLLEKAAAALAKADQPKPTDPVAIDHSLAEKRLEAALKGLQEALLEVGRAERYLVVVDGPSHPDTIAKPRPAWGILSVFVAAIVLVSILSLLGAAVREHAKF